MDFIESLKLKLKSYRVDFEEIGIDLVENSGNNIINIYTKNNFDRYLTLRILAILYSGLGRVGVLLKEYEITKMYFSYEFVRGNIDFNYSINDLEGKRYDFLFIDYDSLESVNFDIEFLRLISDNVIFLKENNKLNSDKVKQFYEYDDTDDASPDWEKIEKKISEVISVLHDELGWFNKEELNNTPRRVMNFYKEWYECSKWEDVRLFENGDGEFGCDKVYDQLIVLRDISISSMCSHHMLPFVGKCHIVYLPGDKVVGVSKLARIVKKFASKPQIQEQLTNEISEFILSEMSCKFVLVIIEAQHMCMKIRGVKESESKMVTSAIRWNNRLISDDKIEGLKQEALKLIYR
jgi:GTP cyclohydrolase I